MRARVATTSITFTTSAVTANSANNATPHSHALARAQTRAHTESVWKLCLKRSTCVLLKIATAVVGVCFADFRVRPPDCVATTHTNKKEVLAGNKHAGNASEHIRYVAQQALTTPPNTVLYQASKSEKSWRLKTSAAYTQLKLIINKK